MEKSLRTMKKKITKEVLHKFYFTFGSAAYYPYSGGWVEIEAPDIIVARRVFSAYYPDKIEGILNCADLYTKEQFEKTDMLTEGNLGKKCHAAISINIFES